MSGKKLPTLRAQEAANFATALSRAAKFRMNRRNFFRGCAVGTAAAVSAQLVNKNGHLGVNAAEAAEYKGYPATGAWIPSGCNMCGGQCGIEVFVDNGVAKKIEPLKTNPNNVANVNGAAPADFFTQAQAGGDLGRLCCKGNSGLRSVYDVDRIKTPLRRVGPRGSGQYEPITWTEAISECALRLKTIKVKYGASSMVWFSEDHSFTHAQSNFCESFGTPNYSNHSNICDTSRKSTFKSVVGNDRPLADMEGADCILIFGWNFLSAIKWIHLASIFSRGMAKKASDGTDKQFIYVDPVFNTTASKATQWVSSRPGTDGALALAIARHVIKSGKYDSAWVAKYTYGFEEFLKYLDGDGTYDSVVKDSAWAAAITGVPASEIDLVATTLENAYAAGRKILIDSWSGPGHHTNATQGGRAIACLPLLFGAIDRDGTLRFPRRSGPANLKPAFPPKDKWRVDGRDDVTIASVKYTRKYLYSHSSGIYVEMINRMLEQKDFLGNAYPIKAAVVVFQNLVMSTPNTQKVLDALEMMDFVLCVDTHLSETALMADIIIPGSNYLERFDFNAFWGTFYSVGLRQPVVKSWIGGRSEAQFFIDLGKAMGMVGFGDQPGKNDTDENWLRTEWEEYMAKGLNGGPWANQMTWAELKQKGVWMETGAAGGSKTNSYMAAKTYAAASMRVRKQSAGTGSVAYTVEKVSAGVGSADGIVIDESKLSGPDGSGFYALPDGEPYEAGFATQTRFAQFWDPLLASAWLGSSKPANQTVTGDPNYHPLPFYLPPVDVPTAAYPLYFLSWKEVEHTHTRTFNNGWLMSMRGENRLIIHPTKATALSIAENDRVMVESPDGMVEARAHVAPTIHPECVGWVRGFGHWALGKNAVGKGSHDGWLLKGRAEVHSGQAVHKEAACRVYKIG